MPVARGAPLAPSVGRGGSAGPVCFYSETVTVMFGPRFGGIDHRALSPFGAQAYIAQSEVLVLISSTNTSRPASTFSATTTCRAALNHSSLCIAPTVSFRLKPRRSRSRRIACGSTVMTGTIGDAL